jgi:hypothetical protein
MHSFSTGVKNTSGDERPLKRFRFPRYFSDREVMTNYNQVFSHAYTALQQVEDGQFKNETILFAFDFSGFTDTKQKWFKDKIILCTDSRVLCVHDLFKVKLHLTLSSISEALVPRVEVDKIMFLMKVGVDKKQPFV